MTKLSINPFWTVRSATVRCSDQRSGDRWWLRANAQTELPWQTNDEP